MYVYRMVVGMLQTNCYVLYDPSSKTAAVIDPGGNAPGVLSFLKTNDLKLQDIYITHSHFDHMLAAAPLREATGARVVVHGLEQEGLENASAALYLSIAPEPYRICPADVRIYGGERTVLGDAEVSFLHTPGHSPGSVCIFCENMLFSGDTLFEGTCGRCDLAGGDWIAMRSSLRALAALDKDYIVYPGHGNTTLLSTEREHNQAMIDAVNV